MYFYDDRDSNDLGWDISAQTIWDEANENHLIRIGGVGVILELRALTIRVWWERGVLLVGNL